MDIQTFVQETQRQLNSIERRLNILSGGGQANTASNIGAGGVGLYQQKVGVDLQFRNINAASARISVALDAGNNEVDIDAVEAAIDHDNLLNYVANQHINWTAAVANFLTTGTLNCGGPLTITQNSDAIVLSHDGTNPFIKWSDGNLTLQTDEGTNTFTQMVIKPKGTGGSQISLFDTDSWELLISAEDTRVIIAARNKPLDLQYDRVQHIECWGSIASGNPYFYIYGWETGVARRWGRMYVGGTGEMHIGAGQGGINFDNPISLPGTPGIIDQIIDNGALYICGASTVTLGSSIQLYGEDHATLAGHAYIISGGASINLAAFNPRIEFAVRSLDGGYDQIAYFDKNRRFYLWDANDNVIRQVSWGADNSGGAGFKVLRVPN